MLRTLDRVLCGIETVMMVAMTLLGLFGAVLQVVLRYVFNLGIHWLEAGVVTALVWGMLFAAARAVREGYHPRVELLAMALPKGPRIVLNFTVLLLSLGLCLFYLNDTVFYANFVATIELSHPELGVPFLWPYVVAPVTMALFSLRYALLIVALIRDPASLELEAPFRARIGAKAQAEGGK